MRLLTRTDIEALLDIDTAIATQREAFTALGTGTAWQPDKIGGGPATEPSTVFCYAARLDSATGPVSKFGSVNPGNASRGLPTIHAVLTALDPDTGRPVALMDGAAITTLRTSAASAVAAEHLARPGARTLAVLGAGTQGRAHVRALSRVLALTDVRMWSPLAAEREASAAELGNPVRAVPTAGEALDGADVVVCATLATEPLFGAELLAPGATVLSIGSFEEHRREVGADVLDKSHAVVVDHLATARAHCGPVVAHGAELELVALGDVVAGKRSGRTGAQDVITYLSVGLGVQDAAVAWHLIRRAEDERIGTEVAW
ncbi:ornithine cyclodeaminase family protein [Amycolatopsis granulosa]|uniref:ornithine cyclodeaminase family protein n=1 Tax=Amycolatopsis granulosa TaxID=185684 RepID=UPI001423AA2B|nr:ornithine cyclodeaminase family protein [Amycolatopsis granulosa]NIH83839.1 ornithine cyclodeaminase [Amycolatopsis granulosa]